ncbi:unnamed protein product [Owenia fusiformis]|uniref:Phospholipase A2 n=1 Tax=Owenia fusiformis TaxID=6347 RepID=A0A8J1XS82_OWEFU|nr:unnamed protein product [Owenia fusiformis]
MMLPGRIIRAVTFIVFGVILERAVVQGDLLQMCGQIQLYTGRSCMNYVNYGCYCGWGSRGSVVEDHIDFCCKTHDDCYEDIQKNPRCPAFSTYSHEYDIECDMDNKNCTCGIGTTCSKKLCKCDNELANCLKNQQYRRKYSGMCSDPKSPIGWKKEKYLGDDITDA